MVSCGCDFDESTQRCTNSPQKDECPNLGACGADFGNGFYNDHHFHYGYFSYAAAVACDFAVCSKEDKERFLLLARDYASPSSDDFVAARHKDWYLGHSWASGVCLPANPNGRNQESSSEAIAAYEGAYHPGQHKRARFPTSKAHISAIFHSFRLIFGRAIISRDGLAAWMLFPERARAEHSR